MALAGSPNTSERIFTVIRASRIPGWCFGPILYGIGVIHSRQIPRTIPSLSSAAIRLLTLSFPLCSIVFGVNDVYDYESDLRNPRKIASSLEGGVLAPAFHADILRAATISSLLLLLPSLFTRNLQNVAATSLLVVFGWQYSAPPLRLKEVPAVDSISNGVMVFLSWFVGFSAAGKGIAEAPRKGYMMSLCTAGVHALAAVADVEADRAARMQTLAVVLGARLAAVFAALC
ncbi:hypothetical protein BD309DRAFT_988566 [Dichomitus squalens]|uniref:Uncharacterized protein n=1 Tax=Dichomitus squalens TaxID=114155 RepID=A0A4Q9P248_9APHY|nr:hypothetical protein BD309DRAFT_988566 [Dichomitus squalens]TBU60512.1 hypothetical protein BD310DRAFT_815135 [Dichomitus squalens]